MNKNTVTTTYTYTNENGAKFNLTPAEFFDKISEGDWEMFGTFTQHGYNSIAWVKNEETAPEYLAQETRY